MFKNLSAKRALMFIPVCSTNYDKKVQSSTIRLYIDIFRLKIKRYAINKEIFVKILGIILQKAAKNQGKDDNK